jgi:hypothetical protein
MFASPRQYTANPALLLDITTDEARRRLIKEYG